MVSGSSRWIDRLRQPAYTGENRCIPCTTVNVVISLVLAVGFGILNPILGGAVLALSLAAIYLRGYLVPGTPTLTKRYFPDWLLAKFDKEPEREFDDGVIQTDIDALLEEPLPEEDEPDDYHATESNR